jgi:hypothetical protein
MKRITVKRGSLLILFLISTATLLAWAAERHQRQTLPAALKTLPQPEIVYDPVLLEKFGQLGQALDFTRPRCTYAGTINVHDGADSTKSLHAIGFLFCRADKDSYYRLGNTERICHGRQNIFIQHDQKKILLSNGELVASPPVSNSLLSEKTLRDENYELRSQTSGAAKTLRILNEEHPNCKELSFTYDTLSGKLTRILTRMTDLGDPLNKKRDRVMEVHLDRLEHNGDPGLYPAISEVVTRRAGKWELTRKYMAYELIIL